MNKAQWIRHIENTEGIPSPEHGGDKAAWKSVTEKHVLWDKCPVCLQYARTQYARVLKRRGR